MNAVSQRRRSLVEGQKITLSGWSRILAAAVLVGSTVLAARAQVSDMVSTPTPGSGESYIHMLDDTISPVNGSLSLRINMPMPKDRGINIPFGLTYDSNGVYVYDVGLKAPTYKYTAHPLLDGWNYMVPHLTYQAADGTGYDYAGNPVDCGYNTGFVFTSPTGERHSLAGLQDVYDYTNPACAPFQGNSGGDLYYQAGLDYIVHDSLGTEYAMGGETPYSIEDRNGNVISFVTTNNGAPYGVAGFNMIDTTGRVAVSVTGFGSPDGDTVTIAGLSQPYKISWTGTTPTVTLPVLAFDGSAQYNATIQSNTEVFAYPPLVVISDLELPDQTHYHFDYGSYGLLSKITYPSGAWVAYDWGTNQASEVSYYCSNGSEFVLPNGRPLIPANCSALRISWPAVKGRTVSFDGQHAALHQDFNYSTEGWQTQILGLDALAWWTTKSTTITTTDYVTGQVSSEVHTYSTQYNDMIPHESSVSYRDGTGRVLRTVNKVWDGYAQFMELASLETVLESGLASKTAFGPHEFGGMPDWVQDFDYGETTTLRKTATSYVTMTPPIGGGINNTTVLPSTVTVYDGGGNAMAATVFCYDQQATSSKPGIAGHDDSNYGTDQSVRGNVTQKLQWVNPPGGSNPVPTTANCGQGTTSGQLSTTYLYDQTGQLLRQTDPNGNPTNYSYTDSFSDTPPAQQTNAYLTSITYPQTGSVKHVESFSYAYSDGKLTSSKDENGNSTTYEYNDPWRRLTETDYPDQGQATLCYSEVQGAPCYNGGSPLEVVSTRKINGSASLVTTVVMDGLGHTVQTQVNSDPAGVDYTDMAYDGLGRAIKVSNPHRNTSFPTDGAAHYTFDVLGRLTQTIEQDGSIVHTDYSGNVTTVTDETGRARRSVTDALERLTEVDEPDAGSALASPGVVARASGAVAGSEQFIQTAVSNFSFSASPNSQTVAQAASTTFTVSLAPPSGYNVAMNLNVSGLPPGATVRFAPAAVSGSGSSTLTITTSGTTPTGNYTVTVTGSNGTYNAITTVNLNVTINPAVLMAIINNILLSDSSTSATTASAQTAPAVRASGMQVAAPAVHPIAPAVAPAMPATASASASVFATAAAQANGVYLNTYDTGTVQVTVQNFTATAQYGQGSTPASVATDLASQFNAPNSGSPVSAFVNGAQLNLFANVFGSDGDYTVSEVSSSSEQGTFAQPSFTISIPSLGGSADPAPASFAGASVTLYQYDALGNLLCVEQHGNASGTGCKSYPNPTANDPWRTRMFAFDSLSQLVTAQNPELGKISYSHDPNGNIVSKTDARGITINYNPSDSPIDALNRVSKKTYSNGQTAVTYRYDQGPNGIGHLTGVTDPAGSGSFTYDVMGRISSEQRTTAGVTKRLSYAYNLDSSLATLTYPSGATVTYTPDAAGRMVSVVDNSNSISYVTQAAYAPDNSLTGFTSGGAITNSFSYNNRLQPVNMSATLQQPVFSINYDFHDGNANNGNVFAIVNNRDNSRTESFTYDTLNRLTSAQNAGTDCTQGALNSSKFWGNSYSYDSWGNLLTKHVTKCQSENLNAYADAQNRLHAISGPDYQYDAAGNMTYNVAGPLAPQSYSYDAENRITGAGGFTYTYDADGNRVEKSNGSTGTIYWSMSPGIVAESDLSGNLQSEYVFFNGDRVARKDFPSNAVSYYFSDHLKTASVITDAAGNIKVDEDDNPWGGELQFVDNDSNHYKFTGKERDSESDLDNFGARYYGNALGRFMTPDPSGIAFSNQAFPQSWNLYSYVQNSPVNALDPDGRECVFSDGSFDLANDPKTGTYAGCTKAGGLYYDPKTFTVDPSLGGASNADLAEQYAEAKAYRNSPQEPDPDSAAGGNSSSKGMTTTINLWGPNWWSTQVRHGTIPFRDNNPGDLRPGGFYTPGVVGTDVSATSGRFRVFASQGAGWQGMDALLHSSIYFNRSIDSAVSKWAPDIENNTAAYQQFLSNALGVSGKTPLSSLSAGQFQTLERAIAQQEGLHTRGNYSVTTTSVITPP
jgi:RHS repeat-associated protein